METLQGADRKRTHIPDLMRHCIIFSQIDVHIRHTHLSRDHAFLLFSLPITVNFILNFVVLIRQNINHNSASVHTQINQFLVVRT